jgi:membrane protease YdiL (CAAX protease family)
MEEKNPFDGIKTCANYTHLWQFTAFVILLQIIISTLVALAEKRSGLSFSPFEAMIPALLATGLVSWRLLHRAGVPWLGVLSGWRRGAVRDLKKASLYFGGYALVLCFIFGALVGAYYLLGSGLGTVLKPLSDQNGAENVLLKGIAEFSRPRLLLVLFSACVLAPVVEEIFFRRIVYVALRLKKGFWFSALWSSLLFSLFHGIAAPVILPVGLYFCWVYERERRLPVNIILHSLVNLSMIGLKVLIA